MTMAIWPACELPGRSRTNASRRVDDALHTSERVLYQSERLRIDECDWRTLDLGALRRDPAARTMVVLDQGRVLLDGDENGLRRATPSACCTVFRFYVSNSEQRYPAQLDDTGSVPRRARSAVQLSPSVLLHFYRRRRSLAMQLSAPSHAEHDSFGLLRFVESVRSVTLAPHQVPTRRASRNRDLVPRAQALILAAIDRPHPVDELAEALDVSPFHLAHVFRRDVGASVHQYLLQVRLLTAVDRLRDGASDLSKLALELGFSHHSHFTAHFRRVVGKSPREVRSMLTGSTAEALSVTTYECPHASR